MNEKKKRLLKKLRLIKRKWEIDRELKERRIETNTTESAKPTIALMAEQARIEDSLKSM